MVLYLIAGACISLDLFALKEIGKKLMLSPSLYKSHLRPAVVQILIETALWAGRFILFMYLLLFDLSDFAIRTLAVIAFLVPFLLYLTLLKNNFKKLVLKKREFLLYLLLTSVFFVAIISGEDSWDGSAYHLPIEFLSYYTKSLWGWSEFIYAQWQTSTIELSSSFYDIVFDTPRIGIVLNFVLTYFLIRLLFTMLKPLPFLISMLFLLSTPAALQQLSTRYIDFSISILAVISFVWIYLFASGVASRKLFLISIPIFSLMFGAKVSALLVLVIQIGCLLLISKFNIQSKNIPAFTLTTFSSFIIGNLPVGLRNFIEFNNPFYPYKNPFFTDGYFSYNKVSEGLSGFYSAQIGMAEASNFELFFYQYFHSPFSALFEILGTFFSGEDFTQLSAFYRVFIYDNRLGGFGPWFPIAIFGILLALKPLRDKLIFASLLIGFSMLPTSFHARYYLSFAFLLTFSILIMPVVKWPTKFLAIAITGLVIPFTALNMATFLSRNFSTTEFVRPLDRAAHPLSLKINPDCQPSIHVGSGPWMTTALFGPNFCSVPYETYPVGGSLLDAKIGPEIILQEDLKEIRKFLIQKPKTMVICSYPSNKLNPCLQVKTIMRSTLELPIIQNDISEALNGPQITTLKFDSR